MFMVLLGYRNAPGGLRRKYGDDSIGAIPRVFRTFSLSTAPHFRTPALGRFQHHLLRIVNAALRNWRAAALTTRQKAGALTIQTEAISREL